MIKKLALILSIIFIILTFVGAGYILLVLVRKCVGNLYKSVLSPL